MQALNAARRYALTTIDLRPPDGFTQDGSTRGLLAEIETQLSSVRDSSAKP
jgi:hypothetical protein